MSFWNVIFPLRVNHSKRDRTRSERERVCVTLPARVCVFELEREREDKIDVKRICRTDR